MLQALPFIDEKNLPEPVVAALFLVGFLAGGISASFIGALADRYGRRRACMSFCILYSLSALTILSNHIAILFLGRVLGGVSATLLYSVFESWMVTEFNRVLPDEPASTMSGIFSTMTTLNSVIAIAAGVLAEWVVRVTDTVKAAFMTSIAFMMLAFVIMLGTWVGPQPRPVIFLLTIERLRTAGSIRMVSGQRMLSPF